MPDAVGAPGGGSRPGPAFRPRPGPAGPAGPGGGRRRRHREDDGHHRRSGRRPHGPHRAGRHRPPPGGPGAGPGVGHFCARSGPGPGGGPAVGGPTRGSGGGPGRGAVPAPAGPGGRGGGRQPGRRPRAAGPGGERVARRTGRGGGPARAAQVDLEARRQAVHRARGLRSYTDAAGTAHLHAQGRPEDVALVMAAIGPRADHAFAQARREGRRERPEAYAFDGLVALAGGGGGASSPRAQVLFRVDYEAMLRGYPVDGEVCEVAGFGPVSTQAVLDTLDCGDPVLKAVVTKGHDVVNVAHLGRRPNAHQQTALDWMFPVCAAEGCGTRAAHLETDHRLEWAKSRSTVLGLLDRLCKFHHDRKTYEGWAWSTGGASGRSCLPMTPATLAGLATRPKPWRRLRPNTESVPGHAAN